MINMNTGEIHRTQTLKSLQNKNNINTALSQQLLTNSLVEASRLCKSSLI